MKNNYRLMMRNIFLLLVFITISARCVHQEPQTNNDMDLTNYQPQPYVKLTHPAWSKNATIYEVNIRQYTPEGTFDAFARHLPRLKNMGVDILWLMPIHPIGVENRKGTLGSYYSVKDYYGVNPEFGDLQSFKNLVDTIHAHGMYVIIDWVANHSAWDNPLVEEHPEWYIRGADGNFQPTPWYDWTDIIDFDFDQPGLRKYMTEALTYWVRETNIDGYRCDVAGFIPVDFWENVRRELELIKPVFMLAEWESRDLHQRAFDMTYSWSMWDEMRAVAKGYSNISVLHSYLAHHVNAFPHEAYRMTFVDNHDKNAWEGTPIENFGAMLPACMALQCTVEGMPLVYSGQEAGLDRSLSFFDKDLIDWNRHDNEDFYTRMFTLKHRNQALWNGGYGGAMEQIDNNHPDKVISFARSKNGDRVIAVINFSATPVQVELEGDFFIGSYQDVITGQIFNLRVGDTLQLESYGFLVLEGMK
jgi:glycosidase